jgi:hypothetical protein
MKRADFERKFFNPFILKFVPDKSIDFPSSIHMNNFSENRFFIQADVIHTNVNIPRKLDGCNNFAVDYLGVFCG